MYATDTMDDLFYEAAEGMADVGYADEFDEYEGFEAYDEYDEYEGFEAYDEYDEYDGFEAYDEYDEYDEFDGYDGADLLDALDEIVADALGADDLDEFGFLKKLRRGFKKAVSVAKKVGRGVGKVARVVAPIASKIPIPQAQAVGRIAGILGKLLADGADEFEALDELADFADYYDELDLAAPVIAGLTIRRTMPGVSKLPKSKRVKLVKSVRKSTQMLGRRQGAKTTKAMPKIVQKAKSVTKKTGQPLTKTVAKTTAQVSKSPKTARTLASSVSKMGKMKGGKVYRSGKMQQYSLRGPVTLTIKGR